MSDECVHEKREATISVEFDVCTKHGHAVARAGTTSSDGVEIGAMTDAVLIAIEESIMHSVAQDADVGEYLNEDYLGYRLGDEEKLQVCRVLAHDVLLKRVMGNGYARSMSSGYMSIPRGLSAD